MFQHYLLNFVIATTGVIGLLYAIYWFLKQNPAILSGIQHRVKASGNKQQALRVESTLNLEPRKNLYVVSYGAEKFLLATTLDKTELISPLEVIPQQASVSPSIVEAEAPENRENTIIAGVQSPLEFPTLVSNRQAKIPSPIQRFQKNINQWIQNRLGFQSPISSGNRGQSS